jgi:hypothetical protein
MDKVGALLFAIAIVATLLAASTSCGAFIGAGINLNKQFGDSINFNLGKAVNVGNSAFGLAGLNVDVNWGVNYDLAALAGYPYGYGGLGSVTQGDLGYFVDVNVDSLSGAGFNGAPWGVPTGQQEIQTTHFGNQIAEQAQINDVQVLLPFSGMAVA